jgi:cyclophilin family peptidyl-prolyl cis-trans isomerase
MPENVNAQTCPYCFIDIDIDHHRSKLALAASFVDATDSRYGFSSKDIRLLGGSELSRIPDLIQCDHEWSEKIVSYHGLGETTSIETKPPSAGNRIVIQLFWDKAPLACENFATLCTNGNQTILQHASQNQERKKRESSIVPIGECGKPMTYKDCKVHRVVPDFIMQTGDFVFGNGSGGESIFGKKFKDERGGLLLNHEKGVVSMGNSGKNSNTSQFFITFTDAPQCDGKHVVFGKVLSGFEVLDAVEAMGNKDGGEPNVLITVTDCGAFYPLHTPGSGYWFDRPDPDSYTGKTPEFIVRPRVAIVAPTIQICEKFSKFLVGATVTMIPVEEDCGDCTVEDRMKYVWSLVQSFVIDVVLFAPVYSQACSGMEIPSSWNLFKENIQKDQIFIVSKPMDAVSALKQSWIANVPSFQLDG